MRKNLFLSIIVLLATNLASIAFADDSADSFFMQGNDNYTAGKYGDAINSYKKALNLSPGNAYIYYNMGNAYSNSGMYGDAIK